jgi:hypothetical protein
VRTLGWAGLPGLLALGLLVALRADEPPAQPIFVTETAAGPDVTGKLDHLDTDGTVRLADLVALRRPGTPPPDFPADEQLLFANGDRLPAHVLGLNGDRVSAHLAAVLGTGPRTALPLPAVAVVWLTAPDGVDDPALLRRRLLTGRRARDTVLLRNGDVLEGVLTGLDDRTVRMDVSRKRVTTGRDKVAAVALSTDLANRLRPKGPYARLVLADGTRVSVTRPASADGTTLTGTTLFGAAVRIPLVRVVALDVFQGPAVFLSDLKPRSFEEDRFLDLSWPLVNDGSVDGRDLRLGGGTYARGLGMHSAARVTYDLGGAYRRFEALVGIDDEAGDDQAGRQGSARIRVLADGKPVAGTEREVNARTGPVAVRADVTVVRKLTLVVDFGDRGNVQDRVDWADARLVK